MTLRTDLQSRLVLTPTGPATSLMTILEQLLSYCDRCRHEFYRDMNQLDARFLKLRICSWWRKYFESEHAAEVKLGDLDDISIAILNLMLANDWPIEELIEKIEYQLEAFNGLKVITDARSLRDLTALKTLLGQFSNQMLKRQPLRCSRVTIARAIAMAIDATFHDKFDLLMKISNETGTRALGEGDIHVSQRPSKQSLNLRYKTPDFNLAHIEDDVGQLSNFRRISRPALEVNMLAPRGVCSVWGSLISQPTQRIGFACLGPQVVSGTTGQMKDVENYKISKSTKYNLNSAFETPFQDHPKATELGVFSGVSYRNQAALLKIYDKACEECVDTLIYPELAMNAKTEQAVLDRIAAQRGAGPSLVILGSRHVKRGSTDGDTSLPRITNRLLAIARATGTAGNDKSPGKFEHEKIGTFGFFDKKTSCYYFEDVLRTRRITFLQLDGVPVVMLICKDALQASVLDTLLTISPKYLFVVAMSPRTQEFVHHFFELATRCNTITLFSCFSSPGEVTAGVFGPAFGAPGIVLRNQPGQGHTAPKPDVNQASKGEGYESTSNLGIIRENAQTIAGPSLAYFEYPVEAEPNEPRLRSNQWFRIFPV